MKRNIKKIFIGLTLTISVLAFFLITPSSHSLKKKVAPIISKKKINPKADRLPAAIATKKEVTKKEKLSDRTIIGAPKIPKNILYANQINKNWKKKYTGHFLRMSGGKPIKDFKIQTKRSIIMVKNKVGTYVEHIVVTYKKPNGDPFSFEALIDSETGAIVQTWNQARYEFRKPIVIGTLSL